MSYKNIAVAVSNMPEDKILVDKALSLARADNAWLTLLHINNNLADLYSGLYEHDTEALIEALDQSELAQFRQLIKDIAWPKTRLRFERGIMPETLLETAEAGHYDLLVCGHHHTFLNRLMPVYRGMINKLKADVLVVPLVSD